MMKNNIPFCISQVLQKSVITVDEKGTDAAATTVISVYGGNQTHVQRTVTLDRPFVFALVEHSSNTILFIGQKVN